MSSSEEHLLVIGGLQGLLLAFLLFCDNRLSTASRVLGWLCLIMAFAMPFLRNAEHAVWARVAGWFFSAAAGTLAYLYCRSAILNQALRHR